MRNGKITIFGGRENKRQMSVVENCEIRRVTTMPFEFRLGGCVSDDSEGKFIKIFRLLASFLALKILYPRKYIFVSTLLTIQTAGGKSS